MVNRCKQCGEEKVESMFRTYYSGRSGRYKMCKACEKINTREKYLSSKKSLTAVEDYELHKIHELYEAQRAAGLAPPRKKGNTVGVDLDTVTKAIDKYNEHANSVKQETGCDSVPAVLSAWLTKELTEDPTYYLEKVYQGLKDEFMPQVGINKDTLLPTYDNKYKAVLDKILDRFYEYEDSSY